MSDWKPIESAPRDVDSPSLVHHPKWDAPAVCNFIEQFGEWCIWGDGGVPMPQPTHWMPLPAPPADPTP